MRCFLMGHSDAPHELLERLSAEIERYIAEYGVSEFLECVHTIYKKVEKS